MNEMIWANAKVVTAAAVVRGSVRAVDGRIVEIDEGPRVPARAEDCAGDFLIPGAVELHTDVLERHLAPRPGVRWPGLAAVVAHDAQIAAAGITTVLDGLAVGYVIASGERPRDPRPAADALGQAQDAGALRAEHFLHMRCEVSTEWVLRDFGPFAGHPLVRLVSLMDHTPGQRQFVRLEKYREYYQGKFALSDAQMETLIETRLGEQQRFGEPHRAAITALAQKHGIPLASHDDATTAHIEEAAAAGTVIAEFPTTLEAARAARALDLAILAGAPNLVCGGSHSGNVSAATLAREGLLDIVSSDYVPASLLHAVFLLHRRHGVELPRAVATVTLTPARRVGLDDRGEIAPGKLADLVRVRTHEDVPIIEEVWRRARRIA
jgi:alpha-D-ribose 1-methylphosphonate 5-triphosphate diphosphatase